RYREENTRGSRVLDDGAQDVRIRATLARRTTPGVADDVRPEIRPGVRAAGVVRSKEELEALRVAGRRPVAPVHVPTGDPAGARRHADLVVAAVRPHRRTGDVRSVRAVVAGNERIRSARISGVRRVNRVVP